MKTLQKHCPRIICVISCGFCGLIRLLCCSLCMFRQSSTAPSHPAWHLPRRPRSLDSGQTAGQTPYTASALQRSSSCIRFKLLQIHSHRFICAVLLFHHPKLSVSCLSPVWWKSSPRSSRKWRMRLVWRERSLRTKSWPTRRSPSLLLRWTPSFRERNMNMKVEQVLQAWVKVFVMIIAKLCNPTLQGS